MEIGLLALLFFHQLMNEEIIWQPHPGPQTEVLKRTEFEIIYGGSRGGGKTDAGLAWLLRWIKNPNYRALVIRRNADDLSDWVDRARIMYRGTGAEFAYKPAVIRFPSGAIIRTGHLNDENAYTKYQGHEYQKMVIEELTQIPTEESYLKLISSCRSTVDGLNPQIFITTNPGGVGHAWVKRRFIDIGEWGKPHIDPVTKRSRIFIPARLQDNPTLMEKDPQYADFLDGLPDQLRRAWRDGDWDITAGQVFTEWRRETHVIKPFPIPSDWNKYIAMDWGVNAPFSVGWYACDFDYHTYLYRELHMNGITFEKIFGKPLTPKRLAKVIIEITNKNNENYMYCVADPSMWNKPLGGESAAETMMKVGLKMIEGDNDRANGLNRYRDVLSIAPDGRPYYQVFDTCQETINSIPSLVYDIHKIEDIDTSGNDHDYDRDRYFFMSRPPISRQKPDGEISPIKAHLLKLKNEGYNTEEYD